MRRFRVDNVPDDSDVIELNVEQSHHVTRVLRLKLNATLEAFDGQGGVAKCRIVNDNAHGIELQILERCKVDAVVHRTIVCLAQTKPKALDVALRMVSEIGVTDIYIFPSNYSVTQRPRVERWRRIVSESAKQCGRNHIANVVWSDDFQALLDKLPASIVSRWIASPNVESMEDTKAHPGSGAILVGPEGGFTDDEEKRAQAAGFQPVRLGPHILRADTAAAIAAAFVVSRA